MLDYGFQEGEEVIDIYGRKGKITGVCHCSECEARGFYEPIVQWENEEYVDWITNCEERQGFPTIHRIGNRIFTLFDIEEAERRLKECQKEVEYWQKGIERIKTESGN